MTSNNERKWFMEWIDRLILENIELKREIKLLKKGPQ